MIASWAGPGRSMRSQVTVSTSMTGTPSLERIAATMFVQSNPVIPIVYGFRVQSDESEEVDAAPPLAGRDGIVMSKSFRWLDVTQDLVTHVGPRPKLASHLKRKDKARCGLDGGLQSYRYSFVLCESITGYKHRNYLS